MSDGLVPIGTIIDWWRDENAPTVQPEPAGYQICDGSEIRDAKSPLLGQRVPNLSNLFIRGVTQASLIGQKGGSETAALPASTGSCYRGGTDPGAHSYDARDDNQGWGTGVHLRVDDGSSTEEGQHRHSLGGRITVLPPYFGLLKMMRVS
jgi:hypothetical protein